MLFAHYADTDAKLTSIFRSANCALHFVSTDTKYEQGTNSYLVYVVLATIYTREHYFKIISFSVFTLA